jgi:hypothetical protein
MERKLNLKNDLIPASTVNLSCFCSKINKNTATILGKFRSGARPGTL